MGMSIVLEAAELSYGDRPVLAGVSAEFGPGAIHLIFGETGSGKTSLACVMVGLVRASAGSIGVDGSDPAARGFDRSRVQLAFQFPEVQIFESTVRAEIEFGLKNFGLEPGEIERRCRWSLDRMGLDLDYLDRDPMRLSFGERRRVALASVIAIRPAYLILDEPLAGLDWKGRESLVETLGRLRDEGMASLVLTHETDLLAECGDTVSFIHGGSLQGPVAPGEYLRDLEAVPPALRPDYLWAVTAGEDGRRARNLPRTIPELARMILG
jgi:energy-coupling factor transport system ATP-binding protein